MKLPTTRSASGATIGDAYQCSSRRTRRRQSRRGRQRGAPVSMSTRYDLKTTKRARTFSTMEPLSAL